LPTRKPSETSDALLAYDAGERLRSIRKPTLLMAAADDLLVPWQLSELIAEEIAHARLVKLDHGGHHFIFRKRALYEQVGLSSRAQVAPRTRDATRSNGRLLAPAQWHGRNVRPDAPGRDPGERRRGDLSASRARAAAARALAGAGRYLGPDGLGKRTGWLPID
jgi:alpha/beta hydrolase fold